MADINNARTNLEATVEGFQSPAAWALGVATVAENGDVLDVRYPYVHLGKDSFPGTALAVVVGHTAGTATYEVSLGQLSEAIDLVLPAETVDIPHPNLASWRACRQAVRADALGGRRQLVAAFIGNLDDPPENAVDGWLRLHLLSTRAVRPNGLNIDGIFGVLTNVVWTNLGPFPVPGFELTRMKLLGEGKNITVFGIDKFPRMIDYVIPSGVRIADGGRVRLGAHLAEGTTVMHEGHCNFNAGTLGASMIEGRITSGVIVDDGSDVGGGASIMGTLSGGGAAKITIGKNCLLGANAGVGISLGDDCIVEAGLYVTAGTLVTMPDGSVVKARELSGADGLLFRRNSVSGAVEAIGRTGAAWQGLNTDLHKND